MANKKSRFPSYGLVRGPSHEHGGVAGVVAGEQPVELEGGEWIIPKEVVPDYLPVLKQITNEGRAIQKMENGNTAMDALIASASMQTGLAQPKSPMYQEGGEVYANKKVIPYKAGKKENLYGSDKSAEEQRDIIAQRMTYPGDTFFRPSAGPASGIGALKGVGLNLLLNSLTGGATSGYNALAALIGAGREIKRMGSDKTQIKRMTEGKQPFDPVYFRKDYETGDVYSATRKGWRKLAPKAVSAMEENFPDYMGDIEAYNTGYSYRKKQGGPVYQDGGRVSVKSKLIDAMSESNGLSKEYTRKDLETLDLDTLERLQDTMMERSVGDQYGGIEDTLVSSPGSADMGERRTYANRFDVREGFGPEGRAGTAIEQLSLGSLPGFAAISNLASRAGVNPEGVIGRVLNAPLPIQRTADIGTGDVSYALTRRQGGPVYQEGGQATTLPLGSSFARRKRLQDSFDKLKLQLTAQVLAEKGAEGMAGQMLPRKQQEMRNPTVYGPPIGLMGPIPTDTSAVDTTDDEYQHLLNQLRMRDVNQSINPFTRDTIDTYLDSLRLRQRMKKSKIPQDAGRKKARQGGPVMYQEGGMVQGGQALERIYGQQALQQAGGEAPGGYFPLASQAEPGALMETIRSDRRIMPLQPDTYYQKTPLAKPFDKSNLSYPTYQEEVEEVPKLSTAHLASFGMETPLSKRQQALLFRKGIAPQTLNPQVKGLINRALVQRLTNEVD
jgi:hypothetical protein